MKKLCILCFAFLLCSFITSCRLTHTWQTNYLGDNIVPPSHYIPEITEGEFPFTLIYEVNGEKMEITDTLICEYKGHKQVGTAGEFRRWESSFASERTDLILHKQSDKTSSTIDGVTPTEFYFFIGEPAYYMGDKYNLGIETYGPQDLDVVNFRYIDQKGNANSKSVDAQTAIEKFGIRIISFEISPPTENSFVPPPSVSVNIGFD